MELLYKILDTILPFAFMQYDFMKNAFLATLLISPLFGLLGTMAVNNKMAYFSDALGHSAFTGIAIGVLLGLDSPLFSMIGFGIFLGLVISRVKAYATASADTVISVFSSMAMALGIVILSKNGGFSNYSSFLIGDILTVRPREILWILIALVVCYVIWGFLYNSLLLVSVNPSLASSRGIRTVWVENLFVVMVAVVVELTIQWIGILTINSLLILPAAAARNISPNAKRYHVMTGVFALISGLGGLIISFYADTSAGATMVLTASVLFFLSLWRKHSMGVR